jgi:hypothetical protein
MFVQIIILESVFNYVNHDMMMMMKMMIMMIIIIIIIIIMPVSP